MATGREAIGKRKLTRLAVVGQLDPFVRLGVLLHLHCSKGEKQLAFQSIDKGLNGHPKSELGGNRTEGALREAPDTSPRETHGGRNPAGGGQRELLGEGPRGEGTEAAGDGRHCDG